jgi:hypothetical protein
MIYSRRLDYHPHGRTFINKSFRDLYKKQSIKDDFAVKARRLMDSETRHYYQNDIDDEETIDEILEMMDHYSYNLENIVRANTLSRRGKVSNRINSNNKQLILLLASL